MLSRDALAAALLGALTVLYLAALPLNLSVPDEAHYLHQAKRLLAGEVVYRDFFDLTTPGWISLMAMLFQLFGTTLSTARLTAAVIHALIAVFIYVACRQLGVRRTLAWVTGFGSLLVCQSLYPVASQHWLATLLCGAVLVLCLRPTDGAATPWLCGIIVGCLVWVHQRRGIAMGAGVAVLFVLQAVIARRAGVVARTRLWRRLLALAGGSLLVLVPLSVTLVAYAGWGPVWRALVVFPLVNYRATHSVPWGFVLWGWVGRAAQLALSWLPLALLTPAAMCAAFVVRLDTARANQAATLCVLGAASMLSIAYYPDVIHIAFIAPLFLVALAQGVETATAMLPLRVDGTVGFVVPCVVLIAVGLQLGDSLSALRARFPLRYASAFGPVDLSSSIERRTLEELAVVLAQVPGRTLYCHPVARYTYLLVDARNPTRFYLVGQPPYTDARQLQEIIHTLDVHRVPYVLMDQPREDPVARHIRQHYTPAGTGPLAHRLWQRKAEAGTRP